MIANIFPGIINKQVLNKLKCPICKAPIDIAPRICYTNGGYNYSCANNYDHYSIILDCGELKKELVHIYNPNHQYEIIKTYKDCKFYRLFIFINETDLEGRVIFKFKQNKFETDIDVFDFSKFNIDKAINKIKTLFAFQ